MSDLFQIVFKTTVSKLIHQTVSHHILVIESVFLTSTLNFHHTTTCKNLFCVHTFTYVYVCVCVNKINLNFVFPIQLKWNFLNFFTFYTYTYITYICVCCSHLNQRIRHHVDDGKKTTTEDNKINESNKNSVANSTSCKRLWWLAVSICE